MHIFDWANSNVSLLYTSPILFVPKTTKSPISALELYRDYLITAPSVNPIILLGLLAFIVVKDGACLI